MCAEQESQQIAASSPLHPQQHTTWGIARVCRLFPFAFLCTTKAGCGTSYKEPKYFKYRLLQKYETPFLVVLGSSRRIKREGKWHFPPCQHWGRLFAVALTFPIPYCTDHKTIPPIVSCPRESQAWLPTYHENHKIKQTQNKITEMFLKTLFLKKTVPETVDVRIVVWDVRTVAWGCTNFITSMCFKKIRVKTSTFNTCQNSVFSLSQCSNTALYQPMIQPMTRKPSYNHIPICGSKRSTIHRPPLITPNYCWLYNNLDNTLLWPYPTTSLSLL